MNIILEKVYSVLGVEGLKCRHLKEPCLAFYLSTK